MNPWQSTKGNEWIQKPYLLKKVEVMIRSQMFTKKKSQAYRVTHIFWVISHVDRDNGVHLTYFVIEYDFWLRPDKVTSNKGKCLNQYFGMKSICLWLKISPGFQICHLYLRYMQELLKLQLKMTHTSFPI